MCEGGRIYLHSESVTQRYYKVIVIVYADARQIGARSHRSGMQPICADIPASVFRSAGHLSARCVTVT